MTAFARQTKETPWGSFTWEIRALNHRYLELMVHLPDPWKELEKNIRSLLQTKIQRGKIELTLFLESPSLLNDYHLNDVVLTQLMEISHKIAHYFPKTQIDFIKLLTWPNLFNVPLQREEKIRKEILDLLTLTLKQLMEERSREGEQLKKFILTHLTKLKNNVETITHQLPATSNLARQKIVARFQEYSDKVDSERLEQEIVWLIQKMDITEELERFHTHLIALENALTKGGVVGRRLDFLLQELSREANTMGSKSIDARITHLAIELKVILEQIREQVQNLE